MIFDSDNPPIPNEPDATDYAQSLTKIGLATLAVYHPQLAPLLVAWDQITGIVLNKRAAGFLQSIVDRFRKQERMPESLFRNDEFVSALAQALQAATKTHLQEKLDALRNAVINVALGKQPDPNRQQQFLMLLDRFSEDHLTVLKFLSDPGAYFQRQGMTPPWVVQNGQKLLVNNLICEAMPRLRARLPGDHESTPFQFIELTLGELVSTRLVALERLNDTWAVPAFSSRPGGAPVQKMTTALGDALLTFITEPEPEKGK